MVFRSRHRVISLLAVGLAVAAALARPQAQSGPLAIDRVSLSNDLSTLYIWGDHFGAAPVVTIVSQGSLSATVLPSGDSV